MSMQHTSYAKSASAMTNLVDLETNSFAVIAASPVPESVGPHVTLFGRRVER